MLKQMEVKFGSVPENLSQAIRAIEDTERLMSLLCLIPTASSVDEIESQLNGSNGR